MGIREEGTIFLQAVLNGIVLSAAYTQLQIVRSLIRHPFFVIQIEDGIYWICSGIYTFVQIYYTNNGIIRWYYILGIVIGTLILRKISVIFKKVAEKMYVFTCGKIKKNY